jgi:tyrosyl-tRNA synthetase
MLAKDSVKNRLENGMSFTEFSYQLVQGYDFYYLQQHHNCKLQMGGSDQWGNIVTGTELIRRKGAGEAFALTTPLIKKADGTKFGKTESGNVWLDAAKTTPYKFYQFWLNASDGDASSFIRIFTLLSKTEIEALEAEHAIAPNLRVLQKALAKDITIRVHSSEDFEMAVEASEILFGKGTTESLKKLSEQDLLAIMEGVPQMEISKADLNSGVLAVDFLAEKTSIFPSKGEAKKMIQGGGVSINKEKITDIALSVNVSHLLNERYLIVQKGKKNYFLVKVI